MGALIRNRTDAISDRTMFLLALILAAADLHTILMSDHMVDFVVEAHRFGAHKLTCVSAAVHFMATCYPASAAA
jgi:hypothetical protein